ncbi:MAG: hypothetical protein JJU00_03545 [Opitutales bacterium]|nr:hypothetical protein [Opitutales bacterium]
MQILVIGVPLANVATEAVHGEVEAGEAGRLDDALLAVEGDLMCRIP